jgi:ketosteroid isomerase-like protein
VEPARIEIVRVLDAFCDAIARRDVGVVSDLFLPRDDVMVVTFEDAVLRDRGELAGFLERYARSSTTYSWDWERPLVAVEDDVAWLLAEGVETATTPSGDVRTPYRMTLLCLHRDGRWRIAQAHGSSPHHL